MPSGPVWLDEMDALSLRQALEQTPRTGRGDKGRLQAVWPPGDGGGDDDKTHLWARVEDRDPANAIHVGRRMYVEGTVNPPAPVGQKVLPGSSAEEGA